MSDLSDEEEEAMPSRPRPSPLRTRGSALLTPTAALAASPSIKGLRKVRYSHQAEENQRLREAMHMQHIQEEMNRRMAEAQQKEARRRKDLNRLREAYVRLRHRLYYAQCNTIGLAQGRLLSQLSGLRQLHRAVSEGAYAKRLSKHGERHLQRRRKSHAWSMLHGHRLRARLGHDMVARARNLFASIISRGRRSAALDVWVAHHRGSAYCWACASGRCAPGRLRLRRAVARWAECNVRRALCAWRARGRHRGALAVAVRALCLSSRARGMRAWVEYSVASKASMQRVRAVMATLGLGGGASVQARKAFNSWSSGHTAQLSLRKAATALVLGLRKQGYRSAFITWRGWAEEAGHSRRMLRKGAASLRQQSLCRAVNAWTAYASARGAARTRLEGVMREWGRLGPRRAWMQWVQVAQATAQLVAACRRLLHLSLSRGFECWRLVAEEQRDATRMIRGIMRSLGPEGRMLRAGFNAWLSSNNDAHLMRRVCAVFTSASLMRALTSWAELALLQAESLDAMQRALATFMNLTLRQACNTWVDYAERAGAARRRLQLTLQGWGKLGPRQAMLAWQASARRAMRATRAMVRLRHASALRAFASWRGVCSASSEQRQRMRGILRMLGGGDGRRLGLAFNSWVCCWQGALRAVRAMSAFVQRALRRALLSWGAQTFPRDVAQRVLAAFMCIGLRKAMNAWVAAWAARCRALVRVKLAAREWGRLGPRRAWLAWHAEAASRRALGGLLSRLANRALARGFGRWAAVSAAISRLRRKILRAFRGLGHDRKSLLSALNSWCELVFERRRKLQAVWRLIFTTQLMRGFGAFGRWRRRRRGLRKFRRSVGLAGRSPAARRFQLWARRAGERRRDAVASALWRAHGRQAALMRARLELSASWRAWHARMRAEAVARLAVSAAAKLFRPSVAKAFRSWAATCAWERVVARGERGLRRASLKIRLRAWRRNLYELGRLRAAVALGSERAMSLSAKTISDLRSALSTSAEKGRRLMGHCADLEESRAVLEQAAEEARGRLECEVSKLNAKLSDQMARLRHEKDRELGRLSEGLKRELTTLKAENEALRERGRQQQALLMRQSGYRAENERLQRLFDESSLGVDAEVLELRRALDERTLEATLGWLELHDAECDHAATVGPLRRENASLRKEGARLKDKLRRLLLEHRAALSDLTVITCEICGDTARRWRPKSNGDAESPRRERIQRDYWLPLGPSA